MKFLRAVKEFFYLQSDIGIKGDIYMRRWRFFPDWLPGFRIHNILRSDDDRALHDHPFSFLTIILKGGYWEFLSDGSRTWHGPGSVLWRPAKTLHRIELATRTFDCPEDRWQELVPAWTFVFRSRYFREWGFQTRSGWVHNKKFITKREGHHFDTGEAK